MPRECPLFLAANKNSVVSITSRIIGRIVEDRGDIFDLPTVTLLASSRCRSLNLVCCGSGNLSVTL